jgi:hypothetical protein
MASNGSENDPPRRVRLIEDDDGLPLYGCEDPTRIPDGKYEATGGRLRVRWDGRRATVRWTVETPAGPRELLAHYNVEPILDGGKPVGARLTKGGRLRRDLRRVRGAVRLDRIPPRAFEGVRARVLTRTVTTDWAGAPLAEVDWYSTVAQLIESLDAETS